MNDFPTPLPLYKLFCDMYDCKGTNAEPDMACILCEAPIHGRYFQGNIRKLKEYPEDCHNEVFCSDLCCIWHGNDKVVIVDVRNERSELQKMLKKSLVELARTAKVKITQRVDKKSVQVSKATIVRRLLASKFCTLVGSTNPGNTPPRVTKTIHDRFRLLNCLFSDELAELADSSDDVDRAALDSGAVADNSVYWKLVEERFQNGFPVSSVDGNLWADKLHHEHPFIRNFHEKILSRNS